MVGGSFKRKEQRHINIAVQLDNELTISAKYKILEDILKYLLYQRNQIDLQYEVLLRELEHNLQVEGPGGLVQENTSNTSNQDECIEPATKQSTEEDNKDILANDDYFIKIYRTKDDILRQKKLRKKRRWLVKVKKLVDDFKQVVKVLRLELETGTVTAVSFVLGNSITSANEVYTIALPTDASSSQKENLNERRATMQFFKAFVMNEDLLNHISRPCSIKKMWVMLEKKTISPPCDNWFSCANAKASAALHTDTTDCDTIPRPGFQLNRRSWVVRINIHVPAPDIETLMDFTPTVGQGIIQNDCSSFKRGSRSSRLNLLNTNKSSSFETCNVNSSESILDSSLETCNLKSSEAILGSPLQIYPSENFVCNSYETPVPKYPMECPCTPSVETRYSNKYPQAIVETPCVSSSFLKGRARIANISPRFRVNEIDEFKLIDSDMENIDLCDETEAMHNTKGSMWYVIDQSIKGFKHSKF